MVEVNAGDWYFAAFDLRDAYLALAGAMEVNTCTLEAARGPTRGVRGAPSRVSDRQTAWRGRHRRTRARACTIT